MRQEFSRRGRNSVGVSLILRVCLAATLLSPFAALPASGQNPPPQNPAESQDPPAADSDYHTLYYSAHLPTDRRLSQWLDQAEQLASQNRFSEALPLLEGVLDAPEDGFYLGGNWQSVATGLKSRAVQLIQAWPPEGRAEWELQKGVAARRALRTAVSESDPAAILRLVRDYPVTDAAAEAAIVVGGGLADRSDRSSAAALLHRIAQWPTNDDTIAASRWLQTARLASSAGRTDLVTTSIDSLAAYDRTTLDALRVGGAPIDNLADLQKELTELGANLAQRRHNAATRQGNWLDVATWRQEGGSSARLVEIGGGGPHLWPEWNARSIRDAKHLMKLQKRRDELQRARKAWMVSTSPVAVGDLVVIRTPQQLVAIDWTTGRRVWETRPDAINESANPLTLVVQENGNSNKTVSLNVIEQRVWLDALFGGISADQSRVYCIRGTEPISGNANQVRFGAIRVFNGREQRSQSLSNRLVAYDLRSEGRLLWQADGARNDSPYAGAAFLGPPVTTPHGLFVLAEVGNSVQLLQVEAETGELIWRQPLLDLERGLALELGRRFAGTVPSYGGGLVICPTGAGSVVAIDPIARRLAWAFRFPVSEQMADRNAQSWQRGYSSYQFKLTEQWTRSRVMIDGDRVLVTSPESDNLYCLSLESGASLWEAPRDRGLYVGGVTDNKVIVVGTDRVRAHNRENGKKVWELSAKNFPAESTIGGFGILSEGEYLLPLMDGRLATIDTRSGKLTKVATARDAESLGNLICHRGAIVSQSADSVARFDQAAGLLEQAERRLAIDSNDPSALRTMAEFALIDGKTAEAVELLNRAYRDAKDDSIVRARLTDALMGAFAENYQQYREYSSLLDELVPSGSRRVSLLRLHVDGCAKLGEYDAALDFAWQFFEVTDDELIALDDNRWVLSERWFNSHIRNLWQTASAEARSKCEQDLANWLDQASVNGEVAALGRLYRYFDGIPPTIDHALRLAEELLVVQRDREAELVLLQLDVFPLDANQSEKSAALWQRLLPSNRAASAALASDWPNGRVEVAVNRVNTKNVNRNNRNQQPIRARLQSRTIDYRQLGPAQLALSGTGDELVGWNRWGENIFRDSIEMEGVNRQPSGHDVNCFRFGHFCILNQRASEVVAVDLRPGTKASDDKIGARLWRSRDTSNNTRNRYVQRWQNGRLVYTTRSNDDSQLESRYGEVIAASPSGVLVRSGERLSCYDPLTGDVLWKRLGVPKSGKSLADGRYAYLTPSSGAKGIKIDLVDGSMVGTWKPAGDILSARGGNYAVQEVSGGRRSIRVYSAGKEEQLLTTAVDSAAKFKAVDEGWFVIVDPKGSIQAIDIAAGKQVWKSEIKPEAKLASFEVLLSDSTIYVVTNSKTEAEHRAAGREALDNAPIARGRVYALDRKTGESKWSRAAQIDGVGMLQLQPLESPVLAFAARTGEANSNNRTTCTLLCLDRRTGRSLCRESEVRCNYENRLAVRLDGGRIPAVTLAIAESIVKLEFTSLPFAPEPVADSSVEAGSKQRGTGVLKTIGQWFGSSELLPIDDDD